MKTIKNVLLALFVLSCINAPGQNYKTGIGVRLGGLTTGLTFRTFVNSNSAIEGIAGFGNKNFVLTGLYEKFKPVSNAAGLQWFYGGGAHIGFFSYGSSYWYYKNKGTHIYVEEPGHSSSVFGIDFILGMDYKFNNAPLNIGLDLKPFVDFIYGTQGYFDGALSFRFVF